MFLTIQWFFNARSLGFNLAASLFYLQTGKYFVEILSVFQNLLLGHITVKSQASGKNV